MYQFALTTITKYYRLHGLYNRNLFLTVLEAGKSRSKVLTGWVPGEDSSWLSDGCGPYTESYLSLFLL